LHVHELNVALEISLKQSSHNIDAYAENLSFVANTAPKIFSVNCMMFLGIVTDC
jgi:hypothetical protein